MLETVVNLITDKMLQAQIIEKEDRELYQYGIRNGIMMILNWIMVLGFGICYRHCFEMLTFVAGYSILRSYAGGFHMPTHRSCFLFSIPIYMVSAWAVSNLHFSFYLFLSILAWAVCTLYIVAPVEDSNKPLDSMEQKVYGKVEKFLTTILSVLSLALYYLQLYRFSIAILWAIALTAVLCLIGKGKDRKKVR